MEVRALLFNNPLSPEQVTTALARLSLDPDALLLDVGCGAGEILARAIETYGCRGVGVDPKAGEIERARKRLAFAGDRVALHEAAIQDVDLTGLRFDAAVCVGATHAYGGPGLGYRNTLAALLGTVKPGGSILVGEGYWKREPPLEYLAATGMELQDFVLHRENISAGERLGLELLHEDRSSEESWDRFEGAFWAEAERQLQEDPRDSKVIEQAQHWRRWKDAYLRWGRDTLGFGLYVFRTPGDVSR